MDASNGRRERKTRARRRRGTGTREDAIFEFRSSRFEDARDDRRDESARLAMLRLAML